ncbi:Subtilase-type serine protease [Bordetella tumbae]|uniref:autotransporter domain-containing protein n=1 Tax=Bordetella tumbae TaxID=1649139 RepID=UPI0039EFD48C
MACSYRGAALALLFSFITLIDLQASPALAQAIGEPSNPETWRTEEYYEQWGLGFIRAADAYALGLDGSGVKVGVVDTGVNPHLPEFLNRIGGGYDYVNNTAVMTDSIGHGTMVASVIAANRDGVGMHGVAPGAMIYAARAVTNTDDDSDDSRVAAAWNDLLGQGVRIINNSWSLNERQITYEPADYWLTQMPDVVAAARRAVGADALMIFPAGNTGGSNPESPAGLPLYVPELEPGWLAVSSVYPIFGKAFYWANGCGVAKRWCLYAPGVAIMAATAGGSYETRTGASLAVPHVAGAAALVAQRFPYMTMAQVRQVLLGTAGDMGEPGVDEVYGYGILDVGKAVRGPGKFDWGDFHVSLDQGRSTWSNDITGKGGLIKSGAGSLELTGNSTYTGKTRVDGGELAIAGSIASNTTVGRGGLLSGNGIIIGNLDNAGIVAPGLPGEGRALFIGGNYVQRQGASLLVQINERQEASVLYVSGQAHIDGGKVAVMMRLSDYRGDRRYTILSTGEGVSGRYDELCKCFAFLNVSLAYDARHVYLDVARNGVAFADVGESDNQRSVGAAIERMGVTAMASAEASAATAEATMPDAAMPGGAIPDAETPDRVAPGAVTPSATATVAEVTTNADLSLFQRILLIDTPAARAAFDSLSGELHPSIASALIDDSRYTRDAITNRLRTAVGGAGESSALRSLYASATHPLSDRVSVLEPAVATWGQFYGAWGHMSSPGRSAQLQRSARGFFLGADTAMGDSWRAGVMGGFGSSSLRMGARSSSSSVDSYTLAAYAGAQYGATSLRFGAAHTWHDIDAKRSVSFLSERANSDYHARIAQVFGEAGYQFDVDGAQFEPFVQLAYVRLHTNGFEEGGTVGLKARSANHDATFSTLGLRAETVLGNAETSTLSIHAMMGWQHAFGTLSPKSTFSFIDGSPFTIEGVPLARDALVLDAGLSIAAGKALNIDFSYIGQLAQNSTNQTGRVNLIWRF